MEAGHHRQSSGKEGQDQSSTSSGRDDHLSANHTSIADTPRRSWGQRRSTIPGLRVEEEKERAAWMAARWLRRSAACYGASRKNPPGASTCPSTELRLP